MSDRCVSVFDLWPLGKEIKKEDHTAQYPRAAFHGDREREGFGAEEKVEKSSFCHVSIGFASGMYHFCGTAYRRGVG